MRIFTSRRMNMEVVLKLSVLLGFALFFYMKIHSETVQLYVHPRIVPYMKFGIIAMVLIAITTLGDLFKPRRRNVNLLPYLLFIVPLFMAFVLPAKTMDSSSMSINDLRSSRQLNTAVQYSEGTDTANIPSYDTSSSQSAFPSLQGNKLTLQDDTILIDDDTFIPWIQELYDNIAKYEGKKIEIIGFVFKDKEFSSNEFVAARFSMSCCTADAQAVGLLCTYADALQLQKDTWLKVSGKIRKTDYNGQTIPSIAVDSVEAVEKPKNEYVYPY